INLTVTGDFKLDFGYDLATRTPFLLDTSHFNATTFLGAPNTTYPATIGGTSVTLGNPSAPVTLKLANTSGVAPAPIAVTVTATSHMSDIGNIPFSSVGLNYAGV